MKLFLKIKGLLDCYIKDEHTIVLFCEQYNGFEYTSYLRCYCGKFKQTII